jgi:gluconate 2-dehydrogenase gamma chain
MMGKLSRRSFFKVAGSAAAALATQVTAIGAAAQSPASGKPATASFTFFRPDEAAFIEAATERLIPADANGPGALGAGVPVYIDHQLGGAWGAGERLYRSGPWREGEPTQGYQLSYTPAELFRNALRGVHEDIQKHHQTTFDKLAGTDQDAYLQSLQNGHQDLHGVPGNVFFESLLGLTIEGYFSDPVYGGNRDMGAWKMIGFPGAYASFYDLVDNHGMTYTRLPLSMGEDGRGVIRLHPVHSTPAQKAGA